MAVLDLTKAFDSYQLGGTVGHPTDFTNKLDCTNWDYSPLEQGMQREVFNSVLDQEMFRLDV